MESRSLSKTESKVILSLEAEGRDTVTLAEIRQKAGISPGFARKLAHELTRRGWLQRVRRGTYLLSPSRRGPDPLPDLDPLRYGSHLAEPYFFGYATAAELHGLFPQASQVYYIVTTTRRAVPRAQGSRYRIVRVKAPYFFGATAMSRRDEPLQVSDLERTVLDCLRRPELAGGLSGVTQIISHAKPRLDWNRLSAYLERYGNRSLTLRAGYLMEKVRPSVQAPARWSRAHAAIAADGYVPLDPASVFGRTGPRNKRWHIMQNIPDSVLFAEGEVR